MTRRLQEFKDRNDESQGNLPLQSFFEKRGVQLLVIKADDPEADQKKSVEAYLEKEGKLSETVAEGKIIVEELPKEEYLEEKKECKKENESYCKHLTTNVREIKGPGDNTTSEKTLDKAKEQERDLLESRSQHMRKYLMDKVIPVLAEGVLKVCKDQPNDPIDFLVILCFEIANRRNS
jgi:adenylate kinase